MSAIKNSPENVLPLLREWLQQGQRVCLLTLYNTQNASPRPLGSQMAVAENGEWFGYLSGGCAEPAMASEAVAVINAGENRCVRYGLDSPYPDIQLPCGGGIDVLFDQSITLDMVDDLLSQIAQRSIIGLQFNPHANTPSRVLRWGQAPPQIATQASTLTRWYYPKRRCQIIGAGPHVTALCALASQADFQLAVLTPDQETLEQVSLISKHVELYTTRSQLANLTDDAWSAVVLMFHEHQRETEILMHFLSTEVYYIGALGSQQSHLRRCATLVEQGVQADKIARIHAPVGLPIQAKTSAEIAISVLAELTQVYRASMVDPNLSNMLECSPQ